MSIGECIKVVGIVSATNAKNNALFLMTLGIKDEHTNKYCKVSCVPYMLCAVFSE
jgi:hypothetical protein